MSMRGLFRSVVMVGLLGPMLGCPAAVADDDAQVRPAYMAGSWYPGAPTTLQTMVDELLAKASPPGVSGKPLAIIAPHAGYRYSAPVAAAAYRCLQGHSYKRVIGLAFSHRHASSYRGVDVSRDQTAYATPLGTVPIDREACDRLLRSGYFTSSPGIDRGEHSLELQLPFLQRVLTDFTLVPLYVGRLEDEDYGRVAEAIMPLLDEDTLLVASSDFTHFGPNFGYQPFKENVPEKLRELADKATAPLLQGDFDGFQQHLTETRDTICGRKPIALLLRILAMQGGAEGVRAGFDTSGNITGDWTSSVTYVSVVFTRPSGTLGAHPRGILLRLARQTATAHLNGQEPPTVDAETLPPELRAHGACFVTLENHGRLRGCIGTMVAVEPLYESVIRNAVSACRDYRFVNNPVTAKELGEIEIEISYLTPMKDVQNPQEIVIGRHGLMIALGRARGVLLPQVPARFGWTREEFLAHVCRKAGLPPDAWKRPETRLQSFEAEVFREHEGPGSSSAEE